ncbi:MAG: flagellar motor protein MotB [Oscillospiraceae bacterium]
MNLPKKQKGGGDEWMNTYADMVTLLMCFFVMLFSMSSMDQAKWITFVKSINPNATEVSQIVLSDPAPGDDDVASVTPSGDEMLENMEQLFQEMKEFIEQNEMGGDVQMFEGDGYVFITFKDSVFFDGNSATLRPESTEILTFLAKGLSRIPSEDIKEVRVMGHTNQDDPILKNNIDIDRELSSLRAAHVVSFLQKQGAIDNPKKLFGIGYGQWYPIAPYETVDDRQLNRRVEILIAKTDAVEVTLDQIYTEIYGGGAGGAVKPGQVTDNGIETPPEGQEEPSVEVEAPNV